jgi:hypothetical protein
MRKVSVADIQKRWDERVIPNGWDTHPNGAELYLKKYGRNISNEKLEALMKVAYHMRSMVFGDYIHEKLYPKDPIVETVKITITFEELMKIPQDVELSKQDVETYKIQPFSIVADNFLIPVIEKFGDSHVLYSYVLETYEKEIKEYLNPYKILSDYEIGECDWDLECTKVNLEDEGYVCEVIETTIDYLASIKCFINKYSNSKKIPAFIEAAKKYGNIKIRIIYCAQENLVSSCEMFIPSEDVGYEIANLINGQGGGELSMFWDDAFYNIQNGIWTYFKNS